MLRSNFLQIAGLSSLAIAFQNQLWAAARDNKRIKPIEGSWFEFQHHSAVEGTPWNPALGKFTAEQWDAKIKEMADAGLRYLVLPDIAIYGKSFYPSALLPKHQLGCDDPLEVVYSGSLGNGVPKAFSSSYGKSYFNLVNG